MSGMNGTLKILSVLAVTFSLLGMSIADAEARRMGGGRSFGSKSGFGSVFKRSAAKPRSVKQQAAFNKNQGMRQQMASRGGLMGMLGGLAIGGLLGALLFGGAFENINFFDILIFGAIAFLLFKLLSSRRRSQAQPATGFGGGGGGYGGGHGMAFESEPESRAGTQRPRGGVGFDTDVMFGGGKGSSSRGIAPSSGEADATFDDDGPEPAGVRPAGFNERDFLGGAERAYMVLQKGWNDGDLSEIRGLTTDAMFGLIQDQFNESDADLYVEVLKVNAELLDVREINDVQEATVMFDAILREGQDQRPEQVREVWHFTRGANAREPKWYLDGIQQLED